jgi:phage terminase small subunit
VALNEKQRRFADEYIVDLNATQAARRAGYASDSAGQIAHKLLKNAEIQAEIQNAVAERARRTEVTADRVVLELARLGFGDLRGVAEWDENGVRYRSSEELTDDEAATIESVKHVTTTSEDGTVRKHLELKQHSKTKALEMLGRHLALFTDKLQMNADGDIRIRMQGLPDKSRGDGSMHADDNS